MENPAECKGPTVLNLGCGQRHLDGAVNLDRLATVNPDVVHDINSLPWPFDDNQFKEVCASDILEHCADVVATMEEIHRICQGGAVGTNYYATFFVGKLLQ